MYAVRGLDDRRNRGASSAQTQHILRDWLELTLDVGWCPDLTVNAAVEMACWCSPDHNMHHVREGCWPVANGQFLANRAAAVDHPVGDGHVVMFAIRPFWRWQTQGTFFLGFNTILNWNDLDAGRATPPVPATGAGRTNPRN